MQTAYTMLTTNVTAFAMPFLTDFRNTEEDAGCLEKSIKRAIAEVSFIILSVASLIETIARAILSLPFVAITCLVGIDNCPEIVQHLTLAPLVNPAITLQFMAWTITNIYKEELGDNIVDDYSALEIFPCTTPYFKFLAKLSS